MRVCACTEPEAILSNSREEGCRECVPTKPTPEPTRHTPHSHGESHDRACVCVHAGVCVYTPLMHTWISSVFTPAWMVHQRRPDTLIWMIILEHVRSGVPFSVMNKSLCVFLFVLFCHSCKKKRMTIDQYASWSNISENVKQANKCWVTLETSTCVSHLYSN